MEFEKVLKKVSVLRSIPAADLVILAGLQFQCLEINRMEQYIEESKSWEIVSDDWSLKGDKVYKFKVEVAKVCDLVYCVNLLADFEYPFTNRFMQIERDTMILCYKNTFNRIKNMT